MLIFKIGSTDLSGRLSCLNLPCPLPAEYSPYQNRIRRKFTKTGYAFEKIRPNNHLPLCTIPKGKTNQVNFKTNTTL